MADYTRDQLMQALRNADKAGDTQAATAIARRIHSMDTQPPVERRKPPVPKPQPRSMLQQFGDATVNTLAGLAQGAASIPDVAAEGLAGLARMGIKPAAQAGSTLYRGLGMEGAARRVERNASMADQALAHPFTIGGAVERVAPTPQDAVGKTARVASQLVGGMMVPVGPKVTPPARLPTPKPTNAAREVVREGERAGVRVLTSDVKPPRTFVGKSAQAVGERLPFAGTGGVRQAQQGQRIEAVKNLVQDFGADHADNVLDGVAADLARTRGAELTKLTAAKNAVIDKFDDAVPAPQAIKAIDDQIANLSSINESAFSPVISKLQEFKQALSSGKNLRQIEGNRRLLGDLFKDPSLASISGEGQKALNSIYGPLRNDMGNFIRARGGPGDFAKWKGANDRLASMAGELDATNFKAVLAKSDVTPENVANLLFSKKPSDVRRLVSNLSGGGRAKAQAAILHRALEKAGGLENLSPDKFSGEIARLGKSVGVAFDAADVARIDGLSRVLEATKRASVASAAPPTGVQNSLPIIGAVLADMFGSAGGAITSGAGIGLLARAYESAPVRNLLLKLGRSKAGGAQEAAVAQRAVGAIAAFIEREMPAINDNVAEAMSRSPGRAAAEQEPNAGGIPPQQ